MNFLSLIEAKRDGRVLTAEELRWFISELVAEKIPDYQMAAMLMAIYFRGLNTSETSALTLAMRDSGDVLKFPTDSRPLVDKHSTGGVGDKVSLPLAPLLACLGFRVPMISGRGLGITGGTLDKLESIPGFITALAADRLVANVQTVGCCMAGQTAFMVPADMTLYALRDATATVPSLPLIVSSILSKKLAEGLQALILDVKFGCAAFMQTKEQARELAQAMVSLGNECGVNTRALLTNMDSPLGRAAGNWLEVRETLDCLDGKPVPGLNELVIETAAQLLMQTGKISDRTKAVQTVTECLKSGAPRRKFDEMIVAQGANLSEFYAKIEKGDTARLVRELKSPRGGFVKKCNARIVGEIVRDLGGGRLTKESIINFDVGIDRLVQPGEMIETGGVLARVHAATHKDARNALARLQTAFEFSDEPPCVPPLLHEVIG